MLKFALAAGVVVEWLVGPHVESAVGLGFASMRVLMTSLLAWFVFEMVHLLVRALLLLDDGA
jgi:hypothetical protein